jgi:hypothetical protein
MMVFYLLIFMIAHEDCQTYVTMLAADGPGGVF